MGRTYPAPRGGGSDKGGEKGRSYKGDKGGKGMEGRDRGGKRVNMDREDMECSFNRGGTRGSIDKGGSKGMMTHDSTPAGGGISGADGGISGRVSQLSSVGSGIEQPSFHDPHGVDNISDQENFESDGDSQEDIVRRGSNIIRTPPAHPSQRVWIRRLGKGFDSESVHRQITGLMREFLDGPWPTWRKVPGNICKDMFECFRGLYQWHDSEEGIILQGFKNVLSCRYRDIISGAREESALAARKAGHDFPPKTLDFSVMRDFNPPWIKLDKWQALCEIWDTDAWRKVSGSGKRNRNSSVDGSICIHTGGSITTEQHRVKLTKAMGKEPSWGIVFKQTHLEKNAKLRLAAGESVGNLPEHWVSKRSWNVFDRYEKTMGEKYGPDPTQHPLGDAEVWEHCSGGRKKGRVYGVGSSDPSYAVSGISFGCGSSSQDYALSQKKVNELEKMLEKEVKEREELQARIEQEVKLREEMEARLNGQMLELIKQFTQRGKPTGSP